VKLVIARHGNTFGPKDVIRRVGLTDLPLVEKGYEQAKALGQALLDASLIPSLMFTSELSRTQETAKGMLEIWAGYGVPLPPVHPRRMFNECDYGEDEGKPESDVILRVGQEALEAWDLHAIPPAGWSIDPVALKATWQRFGLEMTERFGPESQVCVVTSNGIARFADALWRGTEGGVLGKLGTGCYGVLYHTPEAGWSLESWNVRPS
jgi:2,3-bisphosphoglycerate-dependent phosphoglycerate mutase